MLVGGLLRVVRVLLVLGALASGGDAAKLPVVRMPLALSRPTLVDRASSDAVAEHSSSDQTREELGSPMPLVTIADDQTLSVHPPTLRTLARLQGPICVLAVSGGAHEGKSTFLNMFADWVSKLWSTAGEPGKGFKVGGNIFDTGTEGAWLRVFSSKEGQPLPGTQCTSLVLIDTQGPPRGAADAAMGAHNLFNLATLASSTVVLNIMAPMISQLSSLSPMLTQAKETLIDAPSYVADLPNLLILERDARLLSQPAVSSFPVKTDSHPSGAHRTSLPASLLAYAWLEPQGDALDGPREAMRELFPRRTLMQMTMPDAHDLTALSRGEAPQAHQVRDLPQSGLRSFYASFDAAAHATLKALRPKALGGVPLHGSELASAIRDAVAALNEGRAPSLHDSVYASLRAQANHAVEAATHRYHQTLQRWMPAADTLDGIAEPGSEAEHVEEVVARVSSAAILGAESLELALSNATAAALAEFARLAPRFGSSTEGESDAASWLEPHVRTLVTSLEARTTLARQTRLHAVRMSAQLRQGRQEVEATIERRVEEQLEARVQERVAAALAAQAAVAEDEGGHAGCSRSDKRQQLVQNILLLGVATAVGMFPPMALVKIAPMMASAPTVLSLVGIYRVAQRPIARAVSVASEGVRSVAEAAASWVDRIAQSGWVEHLVCEHGVHSAPCGSMDDGLVYA